MALSDATYAALQETIARYLAKSNLTVDIPDFIHLAETRLFRRLNIVDFDNTETGTFTGASPTIMRPTGHSKSHVLYYSVGTSTFTVRPKSPNVFFGTQDVREPGMPAVMTVIGSNIHLGPIPDSDYSYVHHYVGKPQHLSSSVTTNTLLQEHPDVYLYACLLEAEPFLKNDSRILVWAKMLQEGLEQIDLEDEQTRYSGGDLIPSPG